MSMIGKFVQVEPGRFKEILSDPSSVTELFMGEAPAAAMGKFADLAGAMKERVQRMAPGALAASMDRMPPEVRERMAKQFESLGINLEELKSGKGADKLFEVMQARLGAMRGPASGGGGGGGKSGAAAPAKSLSLEKDWHAIHYLLSGAVEPGATLLSQAILGGTEIGDDDLGYGPARYFDPKQAADIAREMARADLEAEMRSRFDPARMAAAKIYPGGWKADEIEMLIEQFRALRDFFADAGAHGRAVITCLT
jgi:uncharacterized protein DUF1877